MDSLSPADKRKRSELSSEMLQLTRPKLDKNSKSSGSDFLISCSSAIEKITKKVGETIGAFHNLTSFVLNSNLVDRIILEIQNKEGSLEDLWRVFFAHNSVDRFVLCPERGIYNTLPESFDNVFFMDLSKAGINRLPSLPYRLSVLNISQNHFQELPGSIKDLNFLRILDLSRNCLQGQLIEEKAGTRPLSQLKVLDVSDNQDLESLGPLASRKELHTRVHGTGVVLLATYSESVDAFFRGRERLISLPKSPTVSWRYFCELWNAFRKETGEQGLPKEFFIRKDLWVKMSNAPGFLAWLEHLLNLCTKSHHPTELFTAMMSALYFLAYSTCSNHFCDFSEVCNDPEMALIKLLEVVGAKTLVADLNVNAENSFELAEECLEIEPDWFAFKDRQASGFSIWCFQEALLERVHSDILRFIKLQTFFGITKKYMEACGRDPYLSASKNDILITLLSEMEIYFPWQKWFPQTPSINRFHKNHAIYRSIKSEVLERDLMIVYLKSLPDCNFLKKLTRAYLWNLHCLTPDQREELITLGGREAVKKSSSTDGQMFAWDGLFTQYGSDYSAIFGEDFFKCHSITCSEMTQIAEAVFLDKLVQDQERARAAEEKNKEILRRRDSFLRKDVLSL